MSQNLTVTREGHTAVATLDVPGRTMNVIDAVVLTELRSVVDEVLADDGIHALVLISGKAGSFGGGADLTTLPQLASDPGTEEFLTATHELMELMLASPKPIVVAIDGYALGGALEVALGASTLLVSDRATLGLPESTLGLIPGGGGTQLILERVAADTALELMVSGRSVPAAAAVELGLADWVVSADELLSTALRVATEPRPERTSPNTDADVAAALALGRGVRRPPSAAATAALLDVVETGLVQGRSAGLAAERKHFLELLRSDESDALIHLFHAETAAKRQFRGGDRPTAVAVVGGGQMGAGIAAAAVGHGVSAAVRDIDEARLTEAGERAEKAAHGAGGAWTGTTGWEGFATADVVVEAVFEDPRLKADTLAQVAEVVGQQTLITTNTSAIPVGGLSRAVTHPENFLGTHFFSPVERMPLVELVPHAGTAPEALRRAGVMARTLGKVPVVVADRPGFFTSRVYARWLIEGLRLLADGADPALVEAEAKQVGFPVGPLQASDEVTLDLVLAASVVQVAEQVLTERVDVPAVKSLLERLIAAGHRGKRFAKGFHRYVDGRRDGLDAAVIDVVGAGGGVAPGEAGERLLLAFVTEALQCWDDGTLCHPDDGDVASVLGIGFPRALGGPFRWVDRQGAAAVLARVRRQDANAFPAGDTLVRLAEGNGRFETEPRRDRPAK
ncbi:3-hydroxyacyl-CoA dehydrogenase NAD-binding domain-containing protein [Nocardioides alcanivorans]|uniref:3-hydroxyacyl-CoA dehydrogenase NAD-binding domain-containing protein n=1 Tax=Nocardioides alcanivorans TaxID=2897352 RepID=UPI001F2C9092|nr:3-hydroxyacyl-CoA dehydrogenase NAD-binding domain-containing protein [Nocardioides alcanivorans]